LREFVEKVQQSMPGIKFEELKRRDTALKSERLRETGNNTPGTTWTTSTSDSSTRDRAD
jgi:hypothetical protein